LAEHIALADTDENLQKQGFATAEASDRLRRCLVSRSIDFDKCIHEIRNNSAG
jgi:hypothetical protein